MDLRKLLQMLLQARRSNDTSEGAIDDAIVEVKRQQDIARRLLRLEMDVKLQAKRK